MSSYSREPNRSVTVPRAVIHKKILDVAQSRPDASIEELASRVNGASEDLIERVLDEYGDPAGTDEEATEAGQETGADQPAVSKNNPNEAMSNAKQPPAENGSESVEVTEQQRKLLNAIQEYPDATQKDIADLFDVSQSTINNRLNSIDGFDWEHRLEFIASMSDINFQRDDGAQKPISVRDLSDRVTDLAEQVATVEQRLDERPTSDRPLFGDPDLTCKIVRACMNSENITEEEEDRILKELMQS